MGLFHSDTNAYLSKLQNELKRINLNIVKNEKEIANLSNDYEAKVSIFEREKLHNGILNNRYENFINKIIENGVLLYCDNKGFRLREWDNLVFVKKSGNVVIESNFHQDIKVFNKEQSYAIMGLLQEKNYNLIVIEINSRHIVVQLRVNNKVSEIK